MDALRITLTTLELAHHATHLAIHAAELQHPTAHRAQEEQIYHKECVLVVVPVEHSHHLISVRLATAVVQHALRLGLTAV